MVERLNLRDTVTLTGRLSRPQIQEVFRQTDLFVLPTVLKAFGIAVLEARCAGLPSVVIRSSGAAELVRDGYHGRHASNRRDLAPVIAELLADPLTLERMGRQAREGVEEFAWPQVIQRHLDFYHRAGKVGRVAKRPVVLPHPIRRQRRGLRPVGCLIPAAHPSPISPATSPISPPSIPLLPNGARVAHSAVPQHLLGRGLCS